MSADDSTNLKENTEEPTTEEHDKLMPSDDHATEAIVQNVRTALFNSNDLEDSITAPSMEQEQSSTFEQANSPTVEGGATALDMLESSDKDEGANVVDTSPEETIPEIATEVSKQATAPGDVTMASEVAVAPAKTAVAPEVAAAPALVTTVEDSAEDNTTAKNDSKKQECNTSELERTVEIESELSHSYAQSPQRKMHLATRKKLLLPCVNKHSIFSHGIHSQEHYIPRGAFKRNEQIQRIKDKLLPIHSRPHKEKVRKRQADLEVLYAKMLPRKKSQRNLAKPTTPQPNSTAETVFEKLWDPFFDDRVCPRHCVSCENTSIRTPQRV